MHYVTVDRLLRLTTATTNPHALHHGLSSASLDKIVDGGGEEFPGYRIKDSGFKEVYAEFLADPENFVMTYSKVRQIGNVQLTLLFDNVS